MRLVKTKIDLVVTYDPLATGLTGMLCSLILKARFAPEVNGVYTSPYEYLENETSSSTKFKKFLYPEIEKLVLSRAHGIKILFPTQIIPFEKVLSGKVIRSFPCSINEKPFLAINNTEENNEVLFVGFPFKRKGVDILIAAFKSIARKYPTWKLKILGWFPDMTDLNQAISDHPQIFHHKPVYPPEMPHHIGHCSILVLPSRSEAMGRVLVEAMAAGKPRIGANVDGIPTVINDGIDGLLFEKENTIDLAQKLELLILNPELRRKMGQSGRARVLKEFTREIYYNNLFNFYNEILK
jgi:glycosyltransferase involved in cell wall biosynthesis